MPSENFTPNNVWGSTPPAGTTEELTLPSGQTCAARKVSIEKLIESGILMEADSLTALMADHTVQSKPNGPNGPVVAKVDENALLTDPEGMKAIIGLCEKAMPGIVVSPPVALHYRTVVVGKTTVQRNLNDDERAELLAGQPGLIFTDQIDFMDKMFLFDWSAGGLKAMTPFREGSADGLGTVANVARPKKPSKRASRNK
jgi:hypothetical protein